MCVFFNKLKHNWDTRFLSFAHMFWKMHIQVIFTQIWEIWNVTSGEKMSKFSLILTYRILCLDIDYAKHMYNRFFVTFSNIGIFLGGQYGLQKMLKMTIKIKKPLFSILGVWKWPFTIITFHLSKNSFAMYFLVIFWFFQFTFYPKT